MNAGATKRSHCLETEIRTWRSRFQNARQVGVSCSNGDMDRQAVPGCDGAQQIEIAQDEVGFGNQPQRQTCMPGKFFHDGPGNFVLSLRRLVWISGGADGNALSGPDLLQLLPQ